LKITFERIFEHPACIQINEEANDSQTLHSSGNPALRNYRPCLLIVLHNEKGKKGKIQVVDREREKKMILSRRSVSAQG
jgi:hypothetical protein